MYGQQNIKVRYNKSKSECPVEGAQIEVNDVQKYITTVHRNV
jgi:hypothetical protein